MRSGHFVSHYTPSMMPPEALEAIFVKREHLAERLVDKAVESVTTGSKHHVLLVGPRGIGKTHLISLIFHRLQNLPELKAGVCIAWLREEEYAIASYVDLLVEMLRAITDEAVYNSAKASLYKENPQRQSAVAEDMLLKAVGSRTLIVLTENLEDTFEALGKDGQEKLRALIQNHPVFSIIATAQGLFGSVRLRTSPFYGFFEVQHLEPLSFNEALDLLRKIAGYMGDDALAQMLQTSQGRARVRAIHHLAEGNPRIYVILSQFLEAAALDDLVGPVLKTLDDLTPFYQNRMSLITPQQRKIVEYLCSRDGGAPAVMEIAQSTLLTHQTTSSQLKKLSELGYVRSYHSGRNSYYELSEPLMRIALSTKRHRGEPIRLFVDFLRCWYSRPELEERLRANVNGQDLAYASEALKLFAAQASDPKVIASETDFKRFFEKGDYHHALEAAEELIELRGEASDWTNRGQVEGRLGKHQDALLAFEKALALSPSNARAWMGRGVAAMSLGEDETSLPYFRKALDLEPQNAVFWNGYGTALGILGRDEEAVNSFDKALALEPHNGDVLLQRGIALRRLNRFEEALVSLSKALKANPQDAYARVIYAVALCELNRDEEALASLDRALELSTQNINVWVMHAISLVLLNRYEEALVSVDKALALDPQHPRMLSLRGVLLVCCGRSEEALISFAKFLALQPQDAEAHALRSLSLVRLHRSKEALESMKQLLIGERPMDLRSAVVDAIQHAGPQHAEDWLNLWIEIWNGDVEYEAPLRLLRAAAEYHKKQDKTALLSLPAEERKILLPLLKLAEADLLHM